MLSTPISISKKAYSRFVLLSTLLALLSAHISDPFCICKVLYSSYVGLLASLCCLYSISSSVHHMWCSISRMRKWIDIGMLGLLWKR
ncbi:hypothetical protein BS47DRAFT_682468 [Hydnum rufescens UP504]|uniref:Uncharacterized protein n=1 Tax=Hydnum rufescens UP504 TaxID=1448309 RepID=A0A9P6B3P3_9AGAM|nr:hypothetical protein BS47DRAFT_682468 [Hydnum rufescens UP504]